MWKVDSKKLDAAVEAFVETAKSMCDPAGLKMVAELDDVRSHLLGLLSGMQGVPVMADDTKVISLSALGG